MADVLNDILQFVEELFLGIAKSLKVEAPIAGCSVRL